MRFRNAAIGDVLVALVGLCSLLPIAGGMPAMNGGGNPIGDAIWFTVNLGGPLLLLAGGARFFFQSRDRLLFAGAFAAVLITVGIVRFASIGFSYLLPGWFCLGFIVFACVAAIPHWQLCSLVGACWTAALLGLWSYGGIISYRQAPDPMFPWFLPFEIVAALGALFVIVIHFRLFKSSDAVSSS